MGLNNRNRGSPEIEREDKKLQSYPLSRPGYVNNQIRHISHILVTTLNMPFDNMISSVVLYICEDYMMEMLSQIFMH